MNPFLQSLKTSFVDPFKKVLAKPASPNGSLTIPKPPVANMSVAPTPNMTYASSMPPVTLPKSTAPVVPKSPSYNQSVYDQQIALNAKGAGLKTDGVMGPLTQAAITKYNTPESKVLGMTTTNGQNINPYTGGISDSPVPPPTYATNNTPPTPEVNKYETAVSDAEKAYQAAGAMTEDEFNTKTELDNLLSNTRLGVEGKEGQGRGIPLDLVRGQQAALEKQGLLLSEPLSAKLARIQAKRTSALETSKFALDRADAKLKAENEKNKAVTVNAGDSIGTWDPKTGTFKSAFTAPTKTNPDANQDPNRILTVTEAKDLGVPYGTSAGEAYGKMDPAVTQANADKGKAAQGFVSIIDQLLSSDTGAISGVPSLGAFVPGTMAQKTKNLYNQLKGMLSLANRQQLKGSGAISDFESRTLEKAASSLGRNLSDKDFITTLQQLKADLASGGGNSGSGVVNTTLGPINTNW